MAGNTSEFWKGFGGTRRRASVCRPTVNHDFENVTQRTAAFAVFTISQGKVRFGNGLEVAATTDTSNPPPTGTYDLEIADEAHPGGQGYLGGSTYAKTWFRIGNHGDRYLHPGRISAGCVTVTDIGRWSDVWQYLILARKGDSLNAGTIQIV